MVRRREIGATATEKINELQFENGRNGSKGPERSPYGGDGGKSWNRMEKEKKVRRPEKLGLTSLTENFGGELSSCRGSH